MKRFYWLLAAVLGLVGCRPSNPVEADYDDPSEVIARTVKSMNLFPAPKPGWQECEEIVIKGYPGFFFEICRKTEKSK